MDVLCIVFFVLFVLSNNSPMSCDVIIKDMSKNLHKTYKQGKSEGSIW